MNQFNDANWTGRAPRAMYQSRWGAHARLVAPETVRAERVYTVICLGALALLVVCVACLVL